MFGGFSGIWQWLIVLAIVLLLFGGRGKISALMGDLGKGLRSFKKNVKDDGKSEGEGEESAGEEAKKITAESSEGKDTDESSSKKSESDKKTAANG